MQSLEEDSTIQRVEDEKMMNENVDGIDESNEQITISRRDYEAIQKKLEAKNKRIKDLQCKLRLYKNTKSENISRSAVNRLKELLKDNSNDSNSNVNINGKKKSKSEKAYAKRIFSESNNSDRDPLSNIKSAISENLEESKDNDQ